MKLVRLILFRFLLLCSALLFRRLSPLTNYFVVCLFTLFCATFFLININIYIYIYITGHNLGLAHSGKTEPDNDDDKSAYYEGMCNVNYLVL